MKKNKNNRVGLSIGKLYPKLFLLFPWVLLLGVFQQTYWKYFPLKRFFSGPQFFDWITIVDLYVIIVVIILTVGLAKKAIAFEKKKLPWEFIAGIGLILGAGLLQIFFQSVYEPVLSTPAEYFRSLFIFPILLVILMYKSLDEEQVGKLWRQFLFMEGVFCFLALVQYFSGIFPGDRYDFMQRLTWPYIDFLTLKASSANWAAFFATPGVIVSFIKVFNLAKAKKFDDDFKLYALIFGLCLAVLYLTQSYGAYGAVMAGLGFFMFRSLPLKKFAAALTVLVLIGGGVYLLQKNSYKYQVLTGQKDYRYENSAESRKDIYLMNFQMVKDNPLLGVGLNQYQSYFAKTNEATLGHKYNESQIPPHAHNFFLSMWLSLGFPGLAGILLLVIGALYRSKFRPENIAVFVLAAMMVHGLIDSYYWKQEIAYLFWMILFLTYRLRTQR
jgi:hypothetical protein